MGNQDQPSPEGQKTLLQPRHGRQIEMVGGLVENQELYRMGKYPSKGHSFSLPTRKCGHIAVDLGAYTQPAHGGFGFPSFADGSSDSAGPELRHLLEKTHARTAAPTDLTAIGLVGAGHYPQKC